jgi:mono/diheme cytochrome c family protein
MTRRGSVGTCVFLGVFLGGWPVSHVAAGEATAFGAKVAGSHALRDLRGARRPLTSFTGHKAVVVAFLGAECPIANLYVPGLLDLEKQYRSKQVQFLAVYSNEHEDLDRIAAHAYDRCVPFPVLKDVGQKLADAVGVTRVPTVAVLDGDLMLRYRGRIDDQYGVSFRRPKASRPDLAAALDEVLAGRPVSVPETESDGCLLDRPVPPPARTGVTYSKQVARILQARCQSCHRPEQAAPFSLLTYDDAIRHGRMMKEVTTQRRMPPWHADPRYGHFSNSRRLSEEEIDTLAAWVDAGMPRGDDKDLPTPVEWPEGWLHGKPDRVFEMPEEYSVPATGVVPYQNWVVETGFTEDKWVRIAEARPGNRAVVHHVSVFIVKPGEPESLPDGSVSIMVSWTPGDLGLVCPPDTALRIPKGAKIRIEMHYTPNGTAAKDRSSVGVAFAKEPPKHELFMNVFSGDTFLIPPHDPHYQSVTTWRVPADARILSFIPHLHLRGKHFRYEALYPDGRRETLLSVPRWDFNWQSIYYFQEPLKIPKGTRLFAIAHWDNSDHNPYNPDPTKAVGPGLQSWQEMFVGWPSLVWERPETAAELAKRTLNADDLLFDRLDRDGDGVLKGDELPDSWKARLAADGETMPETLTRAEFGKMAESMRQRMFRKPDAKAAEKKAGDAKP